MASTPGWQPVAALSTFALALAVAAPASENCPDPVGFTIVRTYLSGVGTPAGDDTFKTHGVATVAFPTPPLIDPLTEGLNVWLQDAIGHMILDVELAGAPYDTLTRIGWKVNSHGNSWKYKNPTSNLGINSATVRTLPSQPGVVKFKISGKRAGWSSDGAVFPLELGVAAGPTHCAIGLLTCTHPGTRIKCD